MEIHEINAVIKNSSSIDANHLAQIKESLSLYPYCPSLRILLAKGYYLLDQSEFNEQLKNAAAYTGDRSQLYNLFTTKHLPVVIENKNQETDTTHVVDVPSSSANDAFSVDLKLNELVIKENENDPSLDLTNELETLPINKVDAVPLEEITQMEEEDNVIEEDTLSEQNNETEFEDLPAEGPNTIPEGMQVVRNVDDHMPHTFTYWLRRLRETTEPSFALDRNDEITSKLEVISDDPIFHLDKKGKIDKITIEFYLDKKEDRIIEKFIRQEPKINPRPKDEINTENKGSKSSIDDNEIVSETLAQIYLDQTLISKAIDVYKKLSLKFPEKSAYFATLIEKLKKNKI